jgi:hypothetical protein
MEAVRHKLLFTSCVRSRQVRFLTIPYQWGCLVFCSTWGVCSCGDNQPITQDMSLLKVVAGGILLSASVFALEPVAAGAKVYVNTMEGFGSYLAAALRVKAVPLIVVTDRSIADYEIIGHSESQKAGWAKIIFQKSMRSREDASMNVVDMRTSEVVFAYNYMMENSYRGKQSAAESCAKHLANHIRQSGRLASSLPALTPEQIVARRQEQAPPQNPAKPELVVPQVQATAVIQPRANALLSTAAPVAPAQADPIGLKFTSSPVGAEVLIDGTYWGTTPTAELKRISEGEHTVVVRKRGFKIWERKINFATGESRPVHVELEPEALDPNKPRIAGLD